MIKFFENNPIYAMLIVIGIILSIFGSVVGIKYIIQKEKRYIESLERDGCEIIETEDSMVQTQSCTMSGKVMICHPIFVPVTHERWTCPDGRDFWR